MAGLSDSAGLLFRIRADSSQADRELKSFTTKLVGESEAATTALEGLSSAAIPVAAGIAAAGAAAVAASVAIFRLTKAASDYGSALFDAHIRTGLTAEAMSALGFAAKISGSSLETVSGAVSKFNVLIGQAQQGDEKAIAMLQKYGITARETNEAFAQSIEIVGRMTQADEKAVAIRELYKDKTGQMLPIIDQLDGQFKKYIETAKKLGVTLTEEDLRAADAFGDTLDLLGTQAEVLSFKFVSELMPRITAAMSGISGAMASNQSQATAWGHDLVSLVEGVGIAFTGLKYTAFIALVGIDNAFRANGSAAISWANVMRTSIESVIAPLFVLIQLGKLFGGVTTGIPEQIAATTGAINTRLSLGPPPNIKNVDKGSGGGGKASAPKDDSERLAREAEERRRKEVEAAQKTVQDVLQLWKAGYQERQALLDNQLEQGEITEIEHVRDTARIRLEAVMDEKRQTETLLANSKINLNEEERADILHKIKILEIEIRVEKLKGSSEITAEVKKEIEANERLLKLEQDRLETERKRQNERRNRAANVTLQERIAEVDRLANERDAAYRINTGGTQFDQLFKMFEKNEAAVAGIEVMRSAFEGLAQAIGQAVQAWVLYGNAGQSARKVAAQIIAAIAQQAAIKAIFELAEGFAALARMWFGDPKAGAEAALHFKSAATYGIVAGIAAVAGRGVAGNSFSQQSNSATGGGASGNSSADDRTNFGGPFSGFGKQNAEIKDALNRNTMVMAQLEETHNRLANRIEGVTPGEVVMLGAGDAASAIHGAVQGHLSDNPTATEHYKRNFGDAR